MSIYGQPQQHTCHECAVAWADANSHYPHPAQRGSYGQAMHQGTHLMSPCTHQPPLNFAAGAGPGQHKVLAERYKTKLCRNFVETGACPYEYRCMFAHGEHELRTTEMNLRDGLTTEDAIRHYKRIMQYKALEEMAGIAQPPDYESTLSNNSLLDEVMQRSASGDEAQAAFGSSEWSGSRNGSIAQFRISSQPSFEQLSAAPSRWYQNNPYAWRSFDEVADANEASQEAPEGCVGEGGEACACADCLYQRARPTATQPRGTPAGGPYRSPAIARTIAEHTRRSTRPCPEPVYLRAPSFDAAAYAEVQMP